MSHQNQLRTDRGILKHTRCLLQRVPGLLALFLAGTLQAQDPLELLPEAYKLEFENDWVKVVRVHYAAKTLLPEHDHPQLATTYVYLSDSGPIRFKHVDTKNWEIARPEVKARSFRLWRAVKETHEVDNPNDSASEFLRVELKTEPLNPRTFTGRFQRWIFLKTRTSRKCSLKTSRRVSPASCVLPASPVFSPQGLANRRCSLLWSRLASERLESRALQLK